MTPPGQPTLLGSWWRKLGLVTISLAALLAIAAVPTRILHDTIVHLLRLNGRELPPDVTHSISALSCLGYWLLFAAALLTSLVMALLDLRHIRREFARQKQALLKESLGDELAAATLRQSQRR